MFQLPLKVKSEGAMKGADRKKLRGDIQKQWPLATVDMLKDLIPSKADITFYKVAVDSSNYALIYFHQSQPIVFDYNSVLYPTVYTTWRFPSHMVTLTTWATYAAKLMKGADLPLHAVHFSADDQSRTSQYVQPGRACCVASTESGKSAIAVGRACLSGSRMLLNVAKGTAFVTKHSYGDQLWAVGCKGQPPWIIHRSLLVSGYEEKKGAAMDNRGTYRRNSDVISNNRRGAKKFEDSGRHSNLVGSTHTVSKTHAVSSDINPTEDKMYSCVLNAFTSHMKNAQLPMDAVEFYQQCTKCCKESFYNDKDPLRRSEKIILFLKKLERRNLIALKVAKQRIYIILSVNYEHEDITNYSTSQYSHSNTHSTEGSAHIPYEPPEITELLSVNSTVLPLLSKLGFKKGDTLTKSSLKVCLSKYIASQGLQQAKKPQVAMDKLLTQALCGGKVEIINSVMTQSEIFDRLSKKMDKAYQLIFPYGPVLLRKTAPSVQLSLNASSNDHKTTTIIKHLDRYRLDVDSFAEEIGTARQCSATVSTRQGSSQVVALGNHIAFVYKILKDKYRIPATYIDLV